jgi:chorismate mutase
VLCAAHPDAPFDRSAKALLLPRDPAFKRAVDVWLRGELDGGRVTAARERWLAHPWQDAPRLLGLIDARLAVMSDVARYKWNTGGAIEDAARERELLASLVRQGEALGVPARRTEVFFTAQFAAARRLQQDLFDLWRGQGREKLPPAPDLQQSIRPRLDRISADLVAALADADLRRDAARAAQGTLGTTLLSEAAGRLALEPLANLP